MCTRYVVLRKKYFDKERENMARTVAIGIQNFEDIRKRNYFYIDKTALIKEWWEAGDSVTLLTRPRRFGKTLNMSMLEQFFSVGYAGRQDLFDGLFIWEEEKYRTLQGTYPVISLSFARVKENHYADIRAKICEILRNLYIKFSFLLESNVLTGADKDYYNRMLQAEISNPDATSSLYQLSDFLYRYYGKKVIILLDEYDTPMQEAYVDGYWEDLVAFTRSLFNSTFKTNPYLERAVMTGITRVSKESIFSDLNNLKVVTTTSEEYTTAFGFTEEEVFAALEDCGWEEEKEEVRRWYDGFVFGSHTDIYNPWSILNFLDTGVLATYWANTSGNSLIGKLLRESDGKIKELFELLLKGEVISVPVDEQIVYNQLDQNVDAIWSLLLASGYVKTLDHDRLELLQPWEPVQYRLALTNYEVERMFYGMIGGWFQNNKNYNDFIKALMLDDLDAMNEYMNRVALQTFSYFDTGMQPYGAEPERFYHGFVLGMMVEMADAYYITSNRESSFGRYDVILEPKNPAKHDAIILEFKVKNKRREQTLEETVTAALKQIEEKQYAAELVERGIKPEKIRSYGFAFEGKTVLIG